MILYLIHSVHLWWTWFPTPFLSSEIFSAFCVFILDKPLAGYSSAWYLLHRLRRAMGQRDKGYVLSGVIELDDVYFGAPKSNGKRGRGTDKTSALATVPLTEQEHPCFLKIQISQ